MSRSAASFNQTLRALAADRPRASIAAVAVAVAVFGAWAYWFARVPVTLHAVTEDARLEVEQRSYAVDAPVAGRVVRADLVLGAPVKAGDVVVELDSELERKQLDALKAKLATIEPQVAAANRELAAQQQALSDQERATLAALDEGRARLEQARIGMTQASDEAERAAKLLDAGTIPELQAKRLASDAEQSRAAARAHELDLETIRREQQTRGSQGIARVEDLRRAIASLDGERVTTTADMRVLEERIEKDSIRSPVSGHIGEVASVNAGAFVQPGARLFSVVPDGELKAVADFAPADALGRVTAGQPARLRLTGFPWMQYGTVPATVKRVGGEVRDGRVRVELSIAAPPASPIPMQHGLPATCEIDVERVTPMQVVLRAAGSTLGRPTRRADASTTASGAHP